jgi:hypothetical protein
MHIHCCGSGVIIETYIEGSTFFANSESDSWLKFHKSTVLLRKKILLRYIYKKCKFLSLREGFTNYGRSVQPSDRISSFNPTLILPQRGLPSIQSSIRISLTSLNTRTGTDAIRITVVRVIGTLIVRVDYG